MNDRRRTGTTDLFTIGYLLLSFASGFLELGIIIFALRLQMPLVAVPFLGLAYQLGTIFCRPIRLPLSLYAAITVVAFIVVLTAGDAIIPLFFAVFLLSIGLQGGREMASTRFRLGNFVKRISRVIGFALAGFFNLHVFIGIAGIVLAVILLLRRKVDRITLSTVGQNWRPSFLGITMLIHQSHYFTYAYFIPFLFFNTHGITASLVGLLFCIGWVSYSTAPLILGKQPAIPSFVIGHLLAAITLFIIFMFSHSFLLTLLAWFFSGFGGGTVFFLRKLHERTAAKESDLDLWENTGHIAGLLICLLLIIILGQPNNVFLTAGSIALLTALLFPLGISLKRRNPVAEDTLE